MLCLSAVGGSNGGVGESARSEVGGLQYTAQNLGSSLGTALIGSILIGALAVAGAEPTG